MDLLHHRSRELRAIVFWVRVLLAPRVVHLAEVVLLLAEAVAYLVEACVVVEGCLLAAATIVILLFYRVFSLVFT
jgi:hypothetical protein